VVLQISVDGAVLLGGEDGAARREVVTDPSGLTAAAGIVMPRETAGLEVAVEVLADTVLHREVSWPLEAEGNLEGALGFQLDKLIPFAPDAVYFGYRINRRDKRANQIAFDLVAVPRSVVDPWLGALQESPLGAFLDALWAEPTGRAVNLLPETLRRLETRRGRGARRLLAGAVAALMVAAVALPFVAQEREQSLLDAALAEASGRATKVRALGETVENKAALIGELVAREKSRVYLAPVMAELARLLPDSAYLQRLTVDGSEVRLVGTAESSIVLVDMLSASPWFSDVEFVSKVTRDSRTGRDRFQLKMEARTPDETR
jgi:general secretion pathway protein L